MATSSLILIGWARVWQNACTLPVFIEFTLMSFFAFFRLLLVAAAVLSLVVRGAVLGVWPEFWGGLIG